MALTFELLSENHERQTFDCGEEALTLYLRQFARQDIRREVSRTFILRKNEELRILGYYTLCAGAIDFQELPEQLLKNVPKYSIPVARLARLAVDKKQQSLGYGELLLMDALCRASLAGENMGIYGMVIDAKHEKAKQFYQKYGFQSISSQPLLLFASLKNLRDTFIS